MNCVIVLVSTSFVLIVRCGKKREQSENGLPVGFDCLSLQYDSGEVKGSDFLP